MVPVIVIETGVTRPGHAIATVTTIETDPRDIAVDLAIVDTVEIAAMIATAAMEEIEGTMDMGEMIEEVASADHLRRMGEIEDDMMMPFKCSGADFLCLSGAAMKSSVTILGRAACRLLAAGSTGIVPQSRALFTKVY
ncbi:hypothetical protein ANCDUO_04750 [Ancylostoma duodenale]|uniref:Uncharacterized protein n=1 Tax=Ancylostoma duodenale TaxID=51022 RepID=A0A0C2DQH1_9BILA|nr:hypothetical protein ANCDUO_04750 [Ancylostoma duodenale]